MNEFTNALTEYHEKKQNEIFSKYLYIPLQLRIIESNALGTALCFFIVVR